MVVSIDPRRVYITHPNDVEFKAVRVTDLGDEAVFLLPFLSSLAPAISLSLWLGFAIQMHD